MTNPSSHDIASLVSELIATTGMRAFDSTGRRITHQAFCNLPSDQLNYGTSVTYLLQQIHGHHYNATDPMGYYYYSPDNGETICPIAIARRPLDDMPSVVLVSPRGPNVPQAIETLYRTLRTFGDFPFYIKNPPHDLPPLSLHAADEITPWNAEAPYEDDTYPNVILDVADIANAVGPDNFVGSGEYGKLKKKLRTLMNKTQNDLDAFKLETYTPAEWQRAEKIIDEFFNEKLHRNSLSHPADYRNMFVIEVDWCNPHDNALRAVMTYQGQDLGLVAAERIGNTDRFGICSTLGVAREFQYSELQMLMVVHEIYGMGGKFADMGGAETPSLQEFHTKFLPQNRFRANRAQWEQPRLQPWLQLI